MMACYYTHWLLYGISRPGVESRPRLFSIYNHTTAQRETSKLELRIICYTLYTLYKLIYMCLGLFFFSAEQNTTQTTTYSDHDVCVYTPYILYIKRNLYTGHTYIRVGWCYFLLSFCWLYSFISFRYLFLFFFSLSILWPPFFLVGVPCILGFCMSIVVVVVSLLSTRVHLLPYLYTPTAKRVSAFLASTNSPMYLTLCDIVFTF